MGFRLEYCIMTNLDIDLELTRLKNGDSVQLCCQQNGSAVQNVVSVSYLFQWYYTIGILYNDRLSFVNKMGQSYRM